MASLTDFVARGRVKSVKNGTVIFAPSNTNYELHLSLLGKNYDGPIDELVSARIRVQARKLYTVPSGGGFISPLFGPPRTIQGRALFVGDGMVVIQAGTPMVIQIPTGEDSVDLVEGPIMPGTILNAAAMPGATFELASVRAKMGA
jgi:hypothetical protein